MFILYAVVIGLVLGLLTRGSMSAIGAVRFHWPWLVFGGLLVQIVLFSDPVAARVGDAGPVIYVASTLVTVAAIARNWRLAGMPLVLLGAASNLTAIIGNGGYMPAAPGALAALAKGAPTTYSNSAVVSRPAFEPLTDIFALPAWLPFANIFSIGDVLIGVGVVVAIVTAMHGTARSTVTSAGDPGARRKLARSADA